MADITFSEQMGAIALIDSMRHRALRVSEHLDVAARAEEAKKRIRSFYEQQRIAVDDNLVDAGVQQYFDRRLTFEPHRLGRWGSMAAKAFVSRSLWIPKFSAALAIVVALGLATGMSVLTWDRWQVAVTGRAVQESRDALGALQAEITSTGAQYAQFKGTPAALELEAIRRLVESGESSLRDARAAAQSATLPAVGQALERSDADRLLAAALQVTAQAKALLTKSRGNLALSKDLATQHARLRQLVDIGASALGSSDIVKGRADQARAVFRQADSIGLAPVTQAVADLKSAIDAWAAIAKDAATFGGLRSRLDALTMSAGDRAIAQSYLDAVTAAANKLDAAANKAGLEDLEQLAAFAESALNVSIVDRKGVKSGVERSYDPSKGKSWYLVVEATDAAGAVVPVPIMSIETGQKTFAKLFAVRVSQETYNAVKQDKLADGHVDNKAMGTKPKGALRPVFNLRALGSPPEFILEW